MTNLNNNGANTNRKVAIAATTRPAYKGIDPLAGLDMDTHARLCKTIMSSLYELVPVYRMITIIGLHDTENILARISTVTGGNSPVAREFLTENTIKDMNILVMDSNGAIKGSRKVTTGVKDAKGRMYQYTNELILIKFDMDESSEEARDKAAILYDSIASSGISIVNGDQVCLGKIEGAEHIDVLVATPSNERNKQLLATNVEANIAWERLEKVGGFAISKKLNKEMSLAKFTKLAKRLGIFATPAIPFAKVGNNKFGMVLVNTEIVGDDDFNKEMKDVLTAIGINIDDNQYDGICFFSNNFMLQGINNLGVKGLNARQASMFAPQNRASILYSKCLADVLDVTIISRIIKVLEKRFPNAIKIIGNKNEIGLIVDTNGAKLLDLDFEFDNEGAMVYLLDIAKGTHSGTDNQLSYKLGIMDKAATIKAYEELAYRDMSEFNNGFADQPVSIVADEYFNVNKFLVNLAKNNTDTILANQVFGDKYIMSDIIKDGVKRQEASYRKGRINVDSLFQRAMFDCSSLITDGAVKGLLGVDSRGAIECYSNDVLEEKEELIAAIESSDLTAYEKKTKLDSLLTAFGIKHPAPGMEEIQLFRFITKNEMMNRIANLVQLEIITDEDKDLLFKYFFFTSYGVIKIAPSNLLKHKLAGMDTDFDGIKIVFEKVLVDIVVAFYTKKADTINNNTGMTVTYGGIVPFIDSDKDAIDYLSNNIVSEEEVTNTNLIIGSWKDIFK